MIGQNKIIGYIEVLIENNKFPKFSIIKGPKGSGKKTLAKYIGTLLPDCTTIVLDDNKIDTIRKVIADSMRNKGRPTLYIIPDADSMSVNAKNSLLKITEEPPVGTYIIMTLANDYTMLPTILSRAFKMNMDNYTPYELKEYALSIGMSEEDFDRIGYFCNVPGEIKVVQGYDIDKFLGFVDLVIENIAEVEGANAFKIGEKLALKDEENKFDLALFWKAFNVQCFDRALNVDKRDYLKAIRITSNHLKSLSATGINKHMEFDKWVLDIRQLWLKED